MKLRIYIICMIIISYSSSVCGSTNDECNQASRKVMGEVWKGVKSYESIDKAIEFCLESANKDNLTSQYNLSILYNLKNNNQENEKSYQWTLKAADNGHLYSQFHLGKMYEEGTVVKQDTEQADKWYQKAAESGFLLAQKKLGDNYTNGIPKGAEFLKGIYWYEKAADQGDKSSINRLIHFYSQGTPKLPADKEKELYWIDRLNKL
jgi:uncharacterized protein